MKSTAEISIRNRSGDCEVHRSPRPWRYGTWHRVPVSGIIALVAAVLCGLSTLAVLRTSDGIAIDQWRWMGCRIQPTVLLSILATIANVLFRYAFSEGARVAWWIRAQKGASVAALHQSWEHSQHILSVLAAGRHATLTGFSSLCTVSLLITGPLLQRASTVSVATKQSRTNTSVPVSAQPFNTGATGLFANFDVAPSLYSPLFQTILHDYSRKKPIVLPNPACVGRCDLVIQAAGFDVDCDEWRVPYRLMSHSDFTAWQETLNRSAYPALEQVMFSTNVTYDWQASELYYRLRNQRTGAKMPEDAGVPYTNYVLPFNSIMLTSMVKETEGINGTLRWRTCLLREAVQRYTLAISNDTVTLQSMPGNNNHTIYLVNRYPPEMGGFGDRSSTLGGIWLAVHNMFTGQATMQRNSDWFGIQTQGSSPLTYLNVRDTPGAMNSSRITWKDPTNDMIAMIQELSLRTAIATTLQAQEASTRGAGGSHKGLIMQQTSNSLSQKVAVDMTCEQTVYRSDYQWLTGALAADFIALVAILSLLNRWWQLGRSYTMSPIEIARAFNAPALQSREDNCSISELLESTGSQKLRYGARSFNMPARTDFVASGSNGIERNDNRSLKRRLLFDRAELVEEPRQGDLFAHDL